MKAISAGIRVAILFLLVAVGGYLVWKNLGQNPAGSSNYTLFAKFRDASGLPKGSKVVIAGLPKGEVTGLEVDGRYAKVTFKLDDEIQVFTSGVVVKKATSLLGDNYLEIDPGEEIKALPDGTKRQFALLGPKCAEYHGSGPAADKCRQVPNVIEATTPDQLLRRIEQTLPTVDRVLDSVRDLSEDVRRVVNGPLASVAKRVDGLVEREADTVAAIIERADRSMQKIELIANDLRKITKGADPQVERILRNLDDASLEAKDLVATAKKELSLTGDSLRQKLDKIDGVIENTRSITRKIDSPDTGTLGKLVNDPAIADNVEAITDDARGFLGTLFGLKAVVGLRSEFNYFSALVRNYITLELHTRPDKFYLIELEKGPRGNYPAVSLEFDPTIDPNHWIRKSIIRDEIRFTFQFAKRFAWLTLRYGLKESTGGVGADADVPFLGHRLRLSADVFDFTFDKFPRVKLAAAYEIFRHVYIIGGVDELINQPGYLPIAKGNSDVPIQFDYFRYGRDYFFGGMLRFNDEDIAALLTVAGSAVGQATR
ncbi:MAG: MCE family protein [Deltaproteobacteria bacterium]|nr:MCE family protein [Deltaproteobacteria bacterium]